MKTVAEQLQEIMARLKEIGEDAIKTMEQADEEGLPTSADLVESLGYSYGLADALREKIKAARKTQD